MQDALINRPGEVISFKALSFQTRHDGEVFIFFAHDAFSHYILSTEAARDLSAATIMRKVNELMLEKEFLKIVRPPFILVMDIGDDLLEELNLIVEPHGGEVVFDPQFIDENMMPDLSSLIEMMARGGVDDGR
jgi:hypothetical protein